MFEKQAGRIRKLRADETEVLKDFLYGAIFIPDGSGAWYHGKVLEQYAPCANDDDLVLYLSRILR